MFWKLRLICFAFLVVDLVVLAVIFLFHDVSEWKLRRIVKNLQQAKKPISYILFRDISIKVFEIIPPTTDTELDRGARHGRGQTDRGIKPEIVAEATIEAIGKDDFEVAVGQAQFLRTSSRNEPERVFQMINER
jgi:hypothetical protein